MDTTSITSTTTTSNTATNNTPSTPVYTGEEFDTFIRLLTAQVENQDPLAPLDSTQFVEQLASFTGLELQATANNKLDQVIAALAIEDDA